MNRLTPASMPHYPVGSVHRALQLIHLLRDRGEVRIKDAAGEIGVSESTVHRIMSMLVFHGFARQEENKSYIAGYALGASPVRTAWSKSRRDVATSHMEDLRTSTGETVNIAVRVGTKIRFLLSIEGDKEMHIESRAGRVMPAAYSASGLVMLASLSEDSLRRLYQGPIAEAYGDSMPSVRFESLIRGLRTHQRQGFATANQATELGVAAVAMPLSEDGRVIAALSISVPSVRFAPLLSPSILSLLGEARNAIEQGMDDLARS